MEINYLPNHLGIIALVALLFTVYWVYPWWQKRASRNRQDRERDKLLSQLKPYQKEFGEMWDSRHVYNYMREREAIDDLPPEVETKLELYATLIDDYNEMMEYC